MHRVHGSFILWQAIIAVAVAAGLMLSYRSWRWDAMRSSLRSAHPELRVVQPVELIRWITNKGEQQPLLLDVRTLVEFDVSHIPDARWISPESVPADLALPANQGTPIVLYCSTGRRSGRLAERLQAAGYSRISLLDGGLFRWANEDRILTGAHGPATFVHPESRSAQVLLKRQRRAPDAALLP